MNVPIMAFGPHSGFFDVLLVVYLNFVSVVAKDGSDSILLFGNLTKLCQPIIVYREQHKSRTDTIKRIVERVNSKEKWPPIAVFPEGTCNNRKALVQFKPGAFIPGLPVQPVCLKYANYGFDSFTWTWLGPHPFTLVWLTLCQIHSPIEFHFLPVYNPNEEEKANPELYAENVREVMSKYLEIPLSEYSFEDGRLISKCMEYNMPWQTGAIKVQNLRKKLE